MIVESVVALIMAATMLLSSADPPADPGVAGRASWYDWRPREAAAGPALRKMLGPNWRGKTVVVCQYVGRTCTRVKLTDWCQCYRGTARERIIDLDRRTFALLALPSRGLVRVTVRLP